MLSQIQLVIPELVLLILASIALVLDTYSTSKEKLLTFRFVQITLLIIICLILFNSPDIETYAFNNHFITDPMSIILKTVICIISLVVFFYSHEYLKEHENVRGEYFVLGLFAVLGMMIMSSAASLLTVYLGLELLSLSLYAMIAMHKESLTASEAAMKYFVLGALASGMLLYGISMLYGVTGVLDLQGISAAAASSTDSDMNLMMVFGLVFIVVGIAFKLGAVPFHMWVPDIYEGSPTAVTLFISTAPKIAAFAMTIRLLSDGLQELLTDWQGMLIILSILSMAAGNVIAISQSNIKRMLAYSTIAHIGFFLLGIISGTASGYAGSMFYIIVYALMSMGSFGMIILLGKKGFEADRLEDFKGLAKRSPWYAFIMLILMFSMAGIPPLIGFWAKWFVIKEVVAMGFVWLAAVAVVFSVVGAFYYLRIVKLIYFDEPEQMAAIKASRAIRLVLSMNGMTVLILGFVPGALMALCISAIS
ncbi:MAG: NADH-quinone oxidoreductase subunit NuoN [Gammaproteobacteria bacterium]|nr:NADH-quinone oxidoreductase subunit NuoN [Gammaproteobacteria bacterium]